MRRFVGTRSKIFLIIKKKNYKKKTNPTKCSHQSPRSSHQMRKRLERKVRDQSKSGKTFRPKVALRKTRGEVVAGRGGGAVDRWKGAVVLSVRRAS